MKIQVIKRYLGDWYFRIRSINGRTLCHSKGYASKDMCLKTAKKFNLPIEVKEYV